MEGVHPYALPLTGPGCGRVAISPHRGDLGDLWFRTVKHGKVPGGVVASGGLAREAGGVLAGGWRPTATGWQRSWGVGGVSRRGGGRQQGKVRAEERRGRGAVGGAHPGPSSFVARRANGGLYA